jgi:CRISPR-associated protein Csd2
VLGVRLGDWFQPTLPNNRASLYIFKHASELGNAPAYSFFKSVQFRLKDGTTVPREFEDYDVQVNWDGVAQNVKLEIVGA